MRVFATAVFIAASTAAFAQQPNQGPAPASGQSSGQQAVSPDSRSATGDTAVTGCLTSAQDVYTLTIMQPQTPGATTPTTVAYTLVPAANVDLKSHVNQQVEVRGTDAGFESAARVENPTVAAPTGTSGSANDRKPAAKVQTDAKAQIVGKKFNVNSVRQVAAKCDTSAK